MKTFFIIVTVLAVTTAVYGFDIERVRKFNQDFVECCNEIGVKPSDLNIKALMCATIKDGEVLDENRQYKKEVTLKRLEDLISKADNLKKAQDIYSNCYDDVVQTGATGEKQTMDIIMCVLPIIPLIDPPQ